MAGFNGRQLTFDLNATTLVGVQTKTLKVNREPVDVTSDDDAGWRTLLADPGVKSVDITVAGVTSDEVLIAELFAGAAALSDVVINLPSDLAVPGNITGDFFFTSVEISGESAGEVKFTAEAQSSGPVVYTASAAV